MWSSKKCSQADEFENNQIRKYTTEMINKTVKSSKNRSGHEWVKYKYHLMNHCTPEIKGRVLLSLILLASWLISLLLSLSFPICAPSAGNSRIWYSSQSRVCSSIISLLFSVFPLLLHLPTAGRLAVPSDVHLDARGQDGSTEGSEGGRGRGRGVRSSFIFFIRRVLSGSRPPDFVPV